MSYVSIENLLKARSSVSSNVKKADTFAGIILFLICVKERKQDGKYLISDMKEFSQLADRAFYLIEEEASYSDKEWYGLLSNDWLEQVKSSLLGGNKISSIQLLVTLFWYKGFETDYELITWFKQKVGEDVFDVLFLSNESELYLTEETPISKNSLLREFGGNGDSSTVKYDGALIKKKAGDLSGAPFGQTLYASAEIKKIICIFDFDFIEKFDLDSKKKTVVIERDVNVLSKPFLLLAGISGTGKTRFVREQAKYTGSLEETYCLVSVRPDWHEPSDLLGYTSRLNGNEYVVTDVLRFLVKAWLEVLASGASFEESTLQGEQAQVSAIRPFWLCLDEMNLAPVEQYFADYLSILETRKWFWEDSSFSYSCDPILKPDVIDGLSDEGKLKLRNDLGLAENEDLWQHFITCGISIPLNLIVAGTVNMDETTHGFSRKVIDRALSFDFGEFFPNNYSEFFVSKTYIKPLSFPIYSQCDSADMLADSYDEDGKETIAFLESVNNVLNNTSFKLAYRALNEILLSVAVHQPKDELSLQAVWDDFLMCKVLPRIEGDIDKLTQQDNQSNILIDLEEVLARQLKSIWGSETRPDLYRSNIDKNEPLTIPCRSEAKLKWMNSRLSIGFASFWP